jgi:hypothetical protein
MEETDEEHILQICGSIPIPPYLCKRYDSIAALLFPSSIGSMEKNASDEIIGHGQPEPLHKASNLGLGSSSSRSANMSPLRTPKPVTVPSFPTISSPSSNSSKKDTRKRKHTESLNSTTVNNPSECADGDIAGQDEEDLQMQTRQIVACLRCLLFKKRVPSEVYQSLT